VTGKRFIVLCFPSSRCASAIQIVRQLESIAETQPKLPSGFAEIVSDDFPGTSCGMFLFRANRRCRKDKLTTGVTGYAAWESHHYS